MDSRPSAQALGSLGAGFIVLTFALIVILDIPKFYGMFLVFYNNRKGMGGGALHEIQDVVEGEGGDDETEVDDTSLGSKSGPDCFPFTICNKNKPESEGDPYKGGKLGYADDNKDGGGGCFLFDGCMDLESNNTVGCDPNAAGIAIEVSDWDAIMTQSTRMTAF